MTNLLSLELKRHRLRSYHLATILSGVSLLGFQYFMAAIPYIDPTDADIALFSSYDFLFNLNHLLGMMVFSILGAVMGARFIVEEYSGRRAILLFSYPLSRKKLMGVKLWSVFLYPVTAMLLCGLAIEGLFFTTESLFPLGSGDITLKTVLWTSLSLLCHSLIVGALTIFAIWIGLLKKSVPVTIVSAVIAATTVCQAVSLTFTIRSVLFMMLGIVAIAAAIAVKHIFQKVETMEV